MIKKNEKLFPLNKRKITISISPYKFNMQTIIIISISQVCYARVLDYRRKFIEAAQRYIDLSYRTAIHDEERMTALKHALICTMLASAGMPAALVK